MSLSVPSELPTQVDVIIVGGGPSGASMGIALARLGVRVLILEREVFPRYRIGETQPPKILSLLSFLGVREEIEAAGFVRMAGNANDWGRGLDVSSFDPEEKVLGFQVERDRFDQILLDTAGRSGCQVVPGARVTGLLRDTEGQISGVRMRGETGSILGPAAGGSLREVRSSFVVDATGPAGLVARSLRIRRREPLRTVALYAYWQGARDPDSFPPGNTIFEALPDAWLWSLPLADGRRNVTCGIDATALRSDARSTSPQDGDVERMYHECLSASRLTAPLLEGARLVQGPAAIDASWYWSERYAGPGYLLCGDAASFIDPLTSQGVVKALGSAVLAAAAINTALRRPEDAQMALDFYDRAERRSYEQYVAAALEFYRTAPNQDRSFWRQRSRPDIEPLASPAEKGSAPPGSSRVLSLDQLLGPSALRLRLRARAGLRLENRPRLEEGFIVMRPALVGTGNDGVEEEGRPYLVDLAVLLPLLDGSRSLERIFEDYARKSGTARAPEDAQRLTHSLARLVEESLIEVLPASG